MQKSNFLFYLPFLSQTLIIHRTAEEGRDHCISQYHFNTLTNIEVINLQKMHPRCRKYQRKTKSYKDFGNKTSPSRYFWACTKSLFFETIRIYSKKHGARGGINLKLSSVSLNDKRRWSMMSFLFFIDISKNII